MRSKDTTAEPWHSGTPKTAPLQLRAMVTICSKVSVIRQSEILFPDLMFFT